MGKLKINLEAFENLWFARDMTATMEDSPRMRRLFVMMCISAGARVHDDEWRATPMEQMQHWIRLCLVFGWREFDDCEALVRRAADVRTTVSSRGMLVVVPQFGAERETRSRLLSLLEKMAEERLDGAKLVQGARAVYPVHDRSGFALERIECVPLQDAVHRVREGAEPAGLGVLAALATHPELWYGLPRVAEEQRPRVVFMGWRSGTHVLMSLFQDGYGISRFAWSAWREGEGTEGREHWLVPLVVERHVLGG